MTAILTDPHLRQCLADIVKQANVSCIVETGTNDGTSTAVFAKMVETVYTCEIDRSLFETSKKRFADAGIENIIQHHGSSDEWLWRDAIMTTPTFVGIGSHRPLYVLDAHWREHWPLLKELQSINCIRGQGYRTSVLIDDFFVPSRPNFVGCYGGLRSADSDGRESELIPCGYNPPFAEELDKFPVAVMPDYPEPTIGYGIFSDFELDLGTNFKRVR